jgi:hypothetical protein
MYYFPITLHSPKANAYFGIQTKRVGIFVGPNNTYAFITVDRDYKSPTYTLSSHSAHFSYPMRDLPDYIVNPTPGPLCTIFR